MSFTILEDGCETTVDAHREGGRVLVSPEDLELSLGWTLKPEGFCRDGACVPVAGTSGVVQAGAVDLAAFAGLLGRPLALDAEAGAACLGESAAQRSAAIRGGLAPEFTLPDLAGRRHSLGDWKGRKALLIAWASW